MKAQLIFAPLRSDLSLDALRNIQQAHCVTLARQQQASRKRMLRYARWARARGFSRGYFDGTVKNSEDIGKAITAISRCYQEAIEAASQDTQIVARKLVAQVIEDIAAKDSQYLERWIWKGLSFLKKNRPLTLHYNPRYQDIIESIRVKLSTSITLQASPDLEHTDFYLEEDNGGVEFCWREIIEEPSSVIDTEYSEGSHAP